MGGNNKLLMPIDGKTMIRGVAEAALGSRVDEVVVVLGWEADKIKSSLVGLNCRYALNTDYEKGQSGSVKAGLAHLNPGTQAVLVLPGDIPLIDSHSIDLTVEEYLKTKSPIVVAAHRGRLGHPILLDKQLFQEIRQIQEETFGLKSVVKNHWSEMRLVETGSDRVLQDVDTPADLEHIGQGTTTHAAN